MGIFSTGWHHPTVLEIRVSGGGELRTVALRGELDISTAGRLRTALRTCAGPGSRPVVVDLVVVDLTALELLAAAGLTVLLEAHRNLQATGGELELSRPTRPVRRALTITGMDALLTAEDA